MSTEVSGYESDTGERDIPTLQDIVSGTPVRRVFGVFRRPDRSLNRKGRAICRILFSHNWAQSRIAAIFGLSTTPILKALENIYSLPDDKSEDYEWADRHDPKIRIKFPPVGEYIHLLSGRNRTVIDLSESDDELDIKASITENLSTEASSCGRPMREAKANVLALMKGDDAEYSDKYKVPTSACSRKTPTREGNRPLANRGVPFPARSFESQANRTTLNGSQRSGVSAAAKRTHKESAREMPDITQSTSTPPTSKKPRYDPPAHQNDDCQVQRHSAPQSFAGSRTDQPSTSVPLPRRYPLPKPATTGRFLASPSSAVVPAIASTARANAAPATGTSELDAFLRNVEGFDLSAHRALFLSQGFDMAALRIMARWSEETVQGALQELLRDGMNDLRGKQGLSPIQLLSLRGAIRGLENATGE
ncbi:hypothetical protein B0H11DRAFT_1975712 [Mycena galericulata]|nr:hypothetical protein B0H11DRAFT_1975712 [Mycena galericulata]